METGSGSDKSKRDARRAEILKEKREASESRAKVRRTIPNGVSASKRGDDDEEEAPTALFDTARGMNKLYEKEIAAAGIQYKNEYQKWLELLFAPKSKIDKSNYRVVMPLCPFNVPLVLECIQVVHFLTTMRRKFDALLPFIPPPHMKIEVEQQPTEDVKKKYAELYRAMENHFQFIYTTFAQSLARVHLAVLAMYFGMRNKEDPAAEKKQMLLRNFLQICVGMYTRRRNAQGAFEIVVTACKPYPMTNESTQQFLPFNYAFGALAYREACMLAIIGREMTELIARYHKSRMIQLDRKGQKNELEGQTHLLELQEEFMYYFSPFLNNERSMHLNADALLFGSQVSECMDVMNTIPIISKDPKIPNNDPDLVVGVLKGVATTAAKRRYMKDEIAAGAAQFRIRADRAAAGQVPTQETAELIESKMTGNQMEDAAMNAVTSEMMDVDDAGDAADAI